MKRLKKKALNGTKDNNLKIKLYCYENNNFN